MKKYVVVSVLLVLFVIALYNSVYFENLSEKKKKEQLKSFNPKELADFFWKNELEKLLKSAVELKTFDSLLVANPKALVKQYGKSVGVTSKYSFVVKGIVKSESTPAEKIPVDVKGNSKYNIQLKYVFSNAARDASGYFKVDDFENTMEFNSVSTELNAKILKEVINPRLDSIFAGKVLKFIGATEVNMESPEKEIEIIPLKLEIVK